MATNKNITMKQYNGTDYDVLYPKTKVSQVDGAVASVNNVTPDNTGAVKVDTFEQSIKIGKNVDVGTDGGASAVQFHFDGNANAYTSRIVESESGALTVEAILKLTQVLGFEYGGTNANSRQSMNENVFGRDYEAWQSIVTYPTTPGIYRTIGTDVFANLSMPHGLYGVLVICEAAYAMHLYLDDTGRLFYGRSGDSFKEPTTWYILDGIEEKGTSGIWTYVKYQDGTAECWGSKNYSGAANTAWGALYVMTCTPPTYPITFKQKPIVVKDVTQNNGSSCWLTGWSAGSATSMGTFAIARATTGDVNVDVNFHVIGKWK